MYTFFTASDFLPTKWSTADEKAQFGNTLLYFMLTGFLAGRFTEKLYTRLSMCYGHIAHFDRQGFSETWFDSPESIASFVNHLMQWPCHGDAGYPFPMLNARSSVKPPGLTSWRRSTRRRRGPLNSASSPCWPRSKTSIAESQSS